ncbi:hypothetical protein E4U53_008011 [Claviceps sorghi]|nr:hypothetical protein E4U53_008011 [Claviceps sorghi]
MPSGDNYNSSGTNSQGSHFCSHHHGSSTTNSIGYYYLIPDGSYNYAKPGEYTCYDNGIEGSAYTTPNGDSSSSGNASGSQK